MLKKTITYVNPMTDEEVTEDHYFHLSKAELIEMEAGRKGGMQAYLEDVVKSEDNAEIFSTFKMLVGRAYGRKDGDRFVKDPQYTEEFMASEAWSEFLMSLMQDANAAAEFVNGILPRGLDKITSAASVEMPKSETSDPTGLTNPTTPRVLTRKEMVEMDSDELKSGLATGRYKLS